MKKDSCPQVYCFSEDGTMEMRGQMSPDNSHYKWILEKNTLTRTNVITNDVIKTNLIMYKKNNKYFLKETYTGSSTTYKGEYPK